MTAAEIGETHKCLLDQIEGNGVKRARIGIRDVWRGATAINTGLCKNGGHHNRIGWGVTSCYFLMKG